jgi:hypothetical protein
MAKRTGPNKPKKGSQSKTPSRGRRPRKLEHERRVTISFTGAPSLLAEIDEECEKLGITRSSFIESAIRRAIEQRHQARAVLSESEGRDAFINFMSNPAVLSAMIKAMKGDVDDVEGQQYMKFIEQQTEAFKTARGDQEGDE